jgi:hypothetical protein
VRSPSANRVCRVGEQAAEPAPNPVASQTAGTPGVGDSAPSVLTRSQMWLQLVLLWLVSASVYVWLLILELTSPTVAAGAMVAFPLLVGLNRRVPQQWVAYAYPKEAEEEAEEERALHAYAAEYPPWHPLRRETRIWRLISPVLTLAMWALPGNSSYVSRSGKRYGWPMAPGYVRFVLRRTGHSRSRVSNLVRAFNLLRLCIFASFWVVPLSLGWSPETAPPPWGW